MQTSIEFSSDEFKPFLIEKQEQPCYAIDIHPNNSLLLVGSGYYIRVIEISLTEELNELQLIEEHKMAVLCLNFFKKDFKSFSFISAADTLIIWSRNQKIWEAKHTLRLDSDHSQIKSIVIHPLEDLFFCGSQQAIQFWCSNLQMKNNEQKEIQQEWVCDSIEYPNVFGLSVNQNGNILLACTNVPEILVMVGSNIKKWEQLFKIPQKAYGLRICFITNEIFAFQERGSRPHDCLKFFKISDEAQSKYNLIGEVTVYGGKEACNSLFPMIYNSQKQQLFAKNGSHLNLISIIQENQGQYLFNLKQSYNFKTENFYGVVNKDGDRLITWDNRSYELQFR